VDILRLQRGGEEKGDGQGDEGLRVSFWGWHRCWRRFRVGERWSRGHPSFPGQCLRFAFCRMKPARRSELLLCAAERWVSFPFRTGSSMA
jgi:hypothetical protein